ncbi:hypothetical protein CBOM_00497 [Ceraceosorus bombacis]|uniref:Uncharacterized protein n=1 Tax=Ceraceosorus bombacis TaxID=401625 RepID=A0A0P1B9K4_9BASI|nr:hypothetical protein CBOM_00497 [Ceraceosorus bombacis]
MLTMLRSNVEASSERLRPILSGRTSKAIPTQVSRTSQFTVSDIAEAAFPSPRIQHALHDAARLGRNTVPMTTQPYRVVGEDGKPVLRLGREVWGVRRVPLGPNTRIPYVSHPQYQEMLDKIQAETKELLRESDSLAYKGPRPRARS